MTFTIDEVRKKLEEGTHILMPVKADGEMSEAIWRYYSTRLKFKDRSQSDACRAECWMALMAFYAIVEVVKARG